MYRHDAHQHWRSSPLFARPTQPGYKEIYKQRSATERINSQAVSLGIERPMLRNGKAIANINTLIYTLINLRFLQRLRSRLQEES
jgi:hypothetical protein